MLHIFNYIIISAAVFLSFFLFFRFPVLANTGKTKSDSKVSIIIPSRNEAHNLPFLLEDLSRQTYPDIEIICVDDASEDDTAGVIKKSNAIYIKASSIPEDWKGKTWACQTGAASASGDYLLFIDADVRLHETAVNELMDMAAPDIPVTVQPFHQTKKFYENFSLFFNMIQTVATKMFLPKPQDTDGLFGPVLLISKKQFDMFDGFYHVRARVVEDFYLGKFYKSKGVDPKLLTGGNLISFRMYSEGFSSLIEGWTKNFSTGASVTSWFMLLLIVVWVTGITVLPVELFISISRGWVTSAILLTSAYVMTVLLICRASRKLGSFPPVESVLYPLPLLVFHLIFIYSLFARYILKSITWKGRKLTH